MLSRISRVQLLAVLWTVACQAPLSKGILQVRILEWVAVLVELVHSAFQVFCILLLLCIFILLIFESLILKLQLKKS